MPRGRTTYYNYTPLTESSFNELFSLELRKERKIIQHVYVFVEGEESITWMFDNIKKDTQHQSRREYLSPESIFLPETKKLLIYLDLNFRRIDPLDAFANLLEEKQIQMRGFQLLERYFDVPSALNIRAGGLNDAKHYVYLAEHLTEELLLRELEARVSTLQRRITKVNASLNKKRKKINRLLTQLQLDGGTL